MIEASLTAINFRKYSKLITRSIKEGGEDMNVRLKLVSALVKVFFDTEPPSYPLESPPSLFLGETFSLQAAYCLNANVMDRLPAVSIQVDCPLPVQVRRVFGVPVRFPHFASSDHGYLRGWNGIYPDLLRQVHDNVHIHLYPRQWNALWLDVEAPPDVPGGTYPLTVTIKDQGQTIAQEEIALTVIPKELPRQKLRHTRWLHADSLAVYYHTPMFSIEHNRALRNYISLAVKRGMNMILTPTHTPPLDTAPGTNRQTAQLVDVFVTPLGYNFRFGKLRDYISMCRHEGIRFFEIAHLFTQWGGRFAPQIMGIKDGSYSQLFGWQTEALSPEYRRFLEAYLPALTQELGYLDILDRCYFHLTDEPDQKDAAHYQNLLSFVRPLLPESKIMDAMSRPDLAQDDPLLLPVPAIDALPEHKTAPGKERWTYYCLDQHQHVTNTFISMPSTRTRILGVQLFLEQVDGFLHWAFNYYFSEYAAHPIDPYLNTDCDGFGPAGDAFQVYPGEGGQPEESLRLLLFQHAMQDLRALQLLEELSSREEVVRLIHEGLSSPLTVYNYPLEEAWLLNLRHRVNQEISKLSQA